MTNLERKTLLTETTRKFMNSQWEFEKKSVLQEFEKRVIREVPLDDRRRIWDDLGYEIKEQTGSTAHNDYQLFQQMRPKQ